MVGPKIYKKVLQIEFTIEYVCDDPDFEEKLDKEFLTPDQWGDFNKMQMSNKEFSYLPYHIREAVVAGGFSIVVKEVKEPFPV